MPSWNSAFKSRRVGVHEGFSTLKPIVADWMVLSSNVLFRLCLEDTVELCCSCPWHCVSHTRARAVEPLDEAETRATTLETFADRPTAA